jgi:hypothetical protein
VRVCFRQEKTSFGLSDHYYYFLKTLPFDNELYMKGMGEARRKFLANLHITILKKYLPRGYSNWRYSKDYVSESALVFLKKRKWEENELIYEHMIPKSRYIKDVCEKKAAINELSTEFIYDLLDKYLWTATIHSEENERLKQTEMPPGWDESDIMSRYKAAKIDLIVHEKDYFTYNTGFES